MSAGCELLVWRFDEKFAAGNCVGMTIGEIARLAASQIELKPVGQLCEVRASRCAVSHLAPIVVE